MLRDGNMGADVRRGGANVRGCGAGLSFAGAVRVKILLFKIQADMKHCGLKS